jgi:hypothetical protein
MKHTPHTEAQEATMLLTTTLSTGKAILIGRHGWAQPDTQHDQLGRLTRAEQDEAWGPRQRSLRGRSTGAGMTNKRPYDQERELQLQGKDPATLRAHGIDIETDDGLPQDKIMYNGILYTIEHRSGPGALVRQRLTYQQIIDREA